MAQAAMFAAIDETVAIMAIALNLSDYVAFPDISCSYKLMSCSRVNA